MIRLKLVLLSVLVHILFLYGIDSGVSIIDTLPAKHVSIEQTENDDEDPVEVEDVDLIEGDTIQFENTDQNNHSICWGYEQTCDWIRQYSHPDCFAKSEWPNVPTTQFQQFTFWEQADFGYIRKQKQDMAQFCKPTTDGGTSALHCAKNMAYCYGRDIFFDFKSLHAAQHTNKYRDDVIHAGEVGGNCEVHRSLFTENAKFKSPLQSWSAELLPFESFSNFRVDSSHCDVIIEKPSILIKLDAGISMFHHFCDFLNLYVSQHMNGSFSQDVQIVFWDTSGQPYNDIFSVTWNVFTSVPVIHLSQFDGKKVCFKEVMFPFLARMIYGMYYNMPLIDGCRGSGLFHAFSNHVLHRLGVTQNGPIRRKIRVTLLSRTTKYRRILNEDELVDGLKAFNGFEVQKVDLNYKMPFEEQLRIVHNSDVFIGIHGSGLTHLLFLPDWAAVFEIYNCDDRDCYFDLARLRGVAYYTWNGTDNMEPEDEGHHPTLGAHAKFTNYRFDLHEFLKTVVEAADYVSNHPLFRAEQEAIENSEEVRIRDEL